MKATEVARWFLLRNMAQEKITEEFDPITHLKLQKLLYYAQGICLAVFNKPLFCDPILAWKHGPVVEEVYQLYKGSGSNPIPIFEEFEDLALLDMVNSDSCYKNTLEATFENYGKYTAWHLRNMTHNERPWKETPDSGIISTDLIKEYFVQEVVDMDED